MAVKKLTISRNTSQCGDKESSSKLIPIKVFEMARDEEFGRMVVANRDIAVGDLVMEVMNIIHKQTHTT